MGSISYVVPAFNCAATLAETITSIFDGNFESGDEVVIVDDGSTDETRPVAENLRRSYDAVKILVHPFNKGSAAAGRNTGIEHAAHDLLFCLDADNLLVPGSVALLKAHLRTERADAAAFGEIHFFEGSPEKVTKTWVLHKEVDFLANINDTTKTPSSSGNYLFTRRSWRAAGRYNESVGGAFDSWAFGVAQLATGTRMVSMGGSFYLHRVGYESTFIREDRTRNRSLLALQILLPYVHLLSQEDVDYIMSPEHRLTWFEALEQRPLRGATGGGRAALSPVGRQEYEPTIREVVRALARKIARRL